MISASTTWHCEAATVLLTVVYCALVAHDLQAGTATRMSSPDWFDKGFCVEIYGPHLTSHTLCFVADVFIGGWLTLENWRWYNAGSSAHSRSLLPVGLAVFTALHGMGHLLVGEVMAVDFMEQTRPGNLLANHPLLFVPYVTVVAVFLGIGPWLGVAQGVPLKNAVFVHTLTVWIFIVHVPTQFAFGAVQLVLNLWYCVPRLLLVGCTSKEDIARRVDPAWAASSIMLPLLMPVVSAEMASCQHLRRFGGHLLYDLSTDVFAVVYSVVLWHSTANGPPPKKD